MFDYPQEEKQLSHNLMLVEAILLYKKINTRALRIALVIISNKYCIPSIMASEYSIVSACSDEDLTCVSLQYFTTAFTHPGNFSSNESRRFSSLHTRQKSKAAYTKHYFPDQNFIRSLLGFIACA